MKKLLCLLLACVLLLCACGKQEAEQVNADFGGSLSLFAFEDESINPLKTKYQTNAKVFAAVMHRGLVKTQQNLEINCDLAEKYEFSQDKTVLTFKLKDTAFSDGTKVTGADVVNSLNTIRQNKESMYYGIFNFVESYSETLDSVTFNLYKPDSGVLYYMNFPVVKESGENVLGAGFYKTADIQSDRILLSAVSNLNTNFETVKVMMYPKEDMAENAFLSNEIDVIDATFSNLARLQSKTGINTVEYISDNFTFIGFNAQNEILGDVNVRRAIASLIDKKALAESLMAGCAEYVNSPFKPKTVYGGLYGGEYEESIEMCEKYLENSSLVPNDLSFKILVNEDSLTKTKVAQYLSRKLSSAGILSSVEAVDFETYLQKINDGEYTIFIGETTVSLNQDFEFLCKSTKYENADLETLFNNFRFETDMTKKQEIAKNIAKHFVDNLPVISLYYQKNTVVTDNDIEGDFKPMQTNLFGGIESFKIKK